jgi:putative membrane protein
MKNRVLAIATVCACMAAPAAFAQGTAGAGTTGTSTAAKQGSTAKASGATAAADTAFAKEAAIGGMAEVELGNLAKTKASSSDVKQFGDRMVNDHGKANDELKQWAQQKNVTLPTTLDAKHQATRDRLSKLSGDAFDKAYMHDMLMDHQKDVAAFKRESTSGKDADLKAWAGKTLPTLQDHLKMAQDTAGKVGAGATKAKAGTTKGKARTTRKR